MKKVILMAAVLAGLGCGIKGPPLPPLETVNDRANNVNAEETSAPPSAASGDGTTIKKDSSK